MTEADSPPWSEEGSEDILGQDRMALSLLRTIEQLGNGTMIAVYSEPGAGGELFMKRLAWMLSGGRQRARLRTNTLLPNPAWYDPWLASPNSSPLSGLAGALAQAAANPQGATDRASDFIAQLNRLNNEQTSGAGGELPMVRVQRAFEQFITTARGARSGRQVLILSNMDRISAARRWELLEGLALLMDGGAELSVVMSLDPADLRASLRMRDPGATDDHLRLMGDRLFDLTLQIPPLGVRRISTLLRRYVGESEEILQESFGATALSRLSVAVAHEPLGSPRFLKLLAVRVMMLAEFALEARSSRTLTEAQWAWVVLSQRWPELRTYMQTTARWAELRQTLIWLQKSDRNPREMIRSNLVKKLEADPNLYRYLHLQAKGFEGDTDGLLWIEGMLRAAGL
ncbi:MAG: hypothetical protein ACI8RZ_002850 [Myxococcota bacterium]|jgi:hypothetical protein